MNSNMQSKGTNGNRNLKEEAMACSSKFRSFENYLSISSLLIIMLISIFAITNSSLWFDELCRISDPVKGDLESTIRTSIKYGQPGYMLYLFLWERVFPSSEFFLRLSNVPFILIGYYFTLKILKSIQMSRLWVFIFFINPIIIYYLNEAVPYIILYNISMAFTYYVFFSEDFNSKSNIIKINITFLLGFFCHFIFGFIYLTYIFAVYSNGMKKISNHFAILLVFSIVYLPLLYIYLKGLGGNATTGFSILNIGYIAYAIAGFAGIGPSRNDLRAHDFSMLQYEVIPIAILVILWVVFALCAAKGLKNILSKWYIKEIFGSLAVYFLSIFIVSALLDFGLWERHIIPVLPLLLITIITFANYVIKSGKLGCVIFICIQILWLFSSANIRFNYYYSKDDYKGVSKYFESVLEQNDEVSIYTNIKYDNDKNYLSEGEYYGFSNANTLKPSQHVENYNIPREEFSKIIDQVTKKNTSLTYIVLFRKSVSNDLYCYFDNKDNASVNSSYNSFKIVELNNGN